MWDIQDLTHGGERAEQANIWEVELVWHLLMIFHKYLRSQMVPNDPKRGRWSSWFQWGRVSNSFRFSPNRDGEMKRVRSPRPFRMYVKESQPKLASLRRRLARERPLRTETTYKSCVFRVTEFNYRTTLAWSRSIGGGVGS